MTLVPANIIRYRICFQVSGYYACGGILGLLHFYGKKAKRTAAFPKREKGQAWKCDASLFSTVNLTLDALRKWRKPDTFHERHSTRKLCQGLEYPDEPCSQLYGLKLHVLTNFMKYRKFKALKLWKGSSGRRYSQPEYLEMRPGFEKKLDLFENKD